MDSQESSPAPPSTSIQSIGSSVLRLLYGPTLTAVHDYWKKNFVWIFVGKMMSLLFNTLFRFVIAFLPRRKHLLISRLQSPFAVILEPKKIKSVIVSTFFPSVCHEVMGLNAMIFIFWMLSFKPLFLLSSFTLSAIKAVSSALSEVADISLGSLDSSLWFIQLGILHDVLCI